MASQTYDIYFDSNEDSNNKGFKESLEYCKNYIKSFNGTNHSYFKDYKGGTVSIISNTTAKTVYTTKVR
jgi:hypothetical protein